MPDLACIAPVWSAPGGADPLFPGVRACVRLFSFQESSHGLCCALLGLRLVARLLIRSMSRTLMVTKTSISVVLYADFLRVFVDVRNDAVCDLVTLPASDLEDELVQ